MVLFRFQICIIFCRGLIIQSQLWIKYRQNVHRQPIFNHICTQQDCYNSFSWSIYEAQKFKRTFLGIIIYIFGDQYQYIRFQFQLFFCSYYYNKKIDCNIKTIENLQEKDQQNTANYQQKTKQKDKQIAINSCHIIKYQDSNSSQQDLSDSLINLPYQNEKKTIFRPNINNKSEIQFHTKNSIHFQKQNQLEIYQINQTNFLRNNIQKLTQINTISNTNSYQNNFKNNFNYSMNNQNQKHPQYLSFVNPLRILQKETSKKISTHSSELNAEAPQTHCDKQIYHQENQDHQETTQLFQNKKQSKTKHIQKANPQNYRTKMCPDGIQCRKRLTCNFAHNQYELRRPYKNRKNPCKRYQKGLCSLGAACPDYHGNIDLKKKNYKYKTIKCEQWQKTGRCPIGKLCIYIHEGQNQDNLQERQNQQQDYDQLIEEQIIEQQRQKTVQINQNNQKSQMRQISNKEDELRQITKIGNIFNTGNQLVKRQIRIKQVIEEKIGADKIQSHLREQDQDKNIENKQLQQSGINEKQRKQKQTSNKDEAIDEGFNIQFNFF